MFLLRPSCDSETAMRDKVLEVFKIYAEGGSINAALDTLGMKRGDFFRVKRESPDLQALYLEIQKARADMMYDEAYEISADVLEPEVTVIQDGDKTVISKPADPRAARVAADIRMKIAAAFDRDRFGDNVKVNIAGTIDLTGALSEARARTLLPGRNLGNAIDVEFEQIPSVQRVGATDKQSGAPSGFVDPFADD
jgi:hypothetical protein